MRSWIGSQSNLIVDQFPFDAIVDRFPIQSDRRSDPIPKHLLCFQAYIPTFKNPQHISTYQYLILSALFATSVELLVCDMRSLSF
jgi:hypothetical protein